MKIFLGKDIHGYHSSYHLYRNQLSPQNSQRIHTNPKLITRARLDNILPAAVLNPILLSSGTPSGTLLPALIWFGRIQTNLASAHSGSIVAFCRFAQTTVSIRFTSVTAVSYCVSKSASVPPPDVMLKNPWFAPSGSGHSSLEVMLPKPADKDRISQLLVRGQQLAGWNRRTDYGSRGAVRVKVLLT